MLRILTVLAAAAGVLATPAPASPPAAKPKLDPGAFIRSAVLAGLTDDGFPPDVARQLADPDNYVGKCELCAPTRQAMDEYGRRKAAAPAKPGRGQTAEAMKKLTSADKATRFAALRDLVAGYMDHGYARADVTADQKKELQAEIAKMRPVPKEGERVATGLNYCPSCDGTCRIRGKKAE
jgi:hypothetical protein